MTLLLSFVVLSVEMVRCLRRRMRPSGRLLLLLLLLSVATLAAELGAPALLAGSETVQNEVRLLLSRDKAAGPARNIAPSPADDVSVQPVYALDTLPLRLSYRIQLPHTPEVYIVFDEGAARRGWLDRRFYLRTVAFDTFQTGRWTRRSDRSRLLRDPDDGAEDNQIVLRPADPRSVGYTVYLRSLSARILPYIPVLNAIQLPIAVEYPNDVLASPIAPQAPFLAYSAMSSPLPAVTPAPGSLASGGSPGPEYVALPDGPLSARLHTLAASLAGSETDPAGVLQLLLRHLQSTCTYSLRVANPDRLDPVENFLFHEKAGHCELFASSFVLLLRARGIPARLAAGYCGGEYDDTRDVFTFFRDNAHAWAEVFSADRGWLIVDPTPPAGPAAPAAPGSPQIVRRGDTLDVHRFSDLARLLAMAQQKPPVAPVGRFSFLRFFTFATASFWFGAVGLFAALLAFVILTVRNGLAGRRSKGRPVAPPSFLRTFLRLFARRGCPIRRGQTLRQYLARLKSAGLVAGECDPLVDYVYDISYRARPRARSVEKSFLTLLRRLPR